MAEYIFWGGEKTAECNIFAIGQQHTEQPEIIVEGRVDQYPETCQVKSPMLDSPQKLITRLRNTQNNPSSLCKIFLSKRVAQFQSFSEWSHMLHYFELKYQNQSLKSGQHGQILNETSNKAKIEKEFDVLETMNIELEHSVATLRKENETLKQHYKDLYDSIKTTSLRTKIQTHLLANNAELKAQIQEKVFAIAALKNDLRKLKGNSVDTKFDKTSVLGKPVLPSVRNQSVVRQPNAFKSARAQMSKQRFASQVDVNKNLSKPKNSSKNMTRFSSNDMVHNHYLDVAKKKIQERDRNSTTSVPTSARIQTTTDDRKPNPRSNNQTSRSLPVSKSSRVTITAVPKADHSKSSSSFSDSKNFESYSTLAQGKVTSINVLKEQSLELSADDDTEEMTFDYNSSSLDPQCQMTSVHNSSGLEPQCQMTFDYNRSSLEPQCQTTFEQNGSSLDSQCNRVHHKCSETEQHHNELDCYSVLCSTIIFNGENKLFKVFRCHYTDASNKRQQQPDSTSSTLTLATTVTANGNFDL
ncbi:hypothetical protein Tco_0206897 [Tanacetum coccineum]